MTLQNYQQAIADLIESGSKVLDIGCGTGQMLSYLKAGKQVRGQGLELESWRVAEAVKSGLSVVQGNGDEELRFYPDKAFDYVILSLTLQVMKHPKEVLEQSLRIGKKVVVVIPNFGQVKNRFYLLLKGRMPVTSALSFQWYETPNIHFCTIKDMVQLAKELGCSLEKKQYLSGEGKAKNFHIGLCALKANLLGEYGVFLLSR